MITLKPGEEFSYWKSIGKPTKEKGYIEGMVLNNGQVLTGIGGGLCQLSNLIYWMTLHTPLTVTERWRHGYDVFPDSKRKLPFGSGATCSYPNIDLQIKNNTNQTFQIRLEITKTHLKGEWYSDKPIQQTYKIVERNHNIKHEIWGGYSRNNQIIRITNNNGHTYEEFITQNSAIMMYEPLLKT